MASPPTLSSLLSAVKRSKRSDEYCVLSALASLSSHEAPVTAAAVESALRLHLLKDTPSNVGLTLRRATGLAEPVSAGPPKTWRLTPNGLETLREQSGLPISLSAGGEAYDYDVGILCALEHPEFSAVMPAFGPTGSWRPVGDARFPHVYRECSFTTHSGNSLRVVGTTSSSMGLTAAAIATSHLLMQFRPKLVIMIGIAAGTRSGGKQFGDVLVADPSVDYNSGKVVLSNGISDFQPDPYPLGLNARLRSVLQKYRVGHPVFDAIRKKWKSDLPVESNRLHIGPVGAADQVIDDPQLILRIQNSWRKLIGVEMETYGVYRACHEAPEPKPRYVSFKAVCDFAAEKTDSWQPYAAFVAAEFTAAFLRSDWENLWPSNK